MKNKNFFRLVIILLFTLSLLLSCKAKNNNRVVIAEQFGLGYAPFTVIREQNLINKYYPKAEVEWVQLGSGGAIREAMVAGRVDIGSMGVPPYLIGWAKGIEWRVISGLCYMPLGMLTNRSDVNTLKDITPEMKIGLPSPGSIQHILLSMAAERQFGDAKAFDNQLVSMAHPDAMNALLNKSEIDAHFTSPPYIFEELKAPGIKIIVDAEKDAFGEPYTFLVSIATNSFHETNPKLFKATAQAFDEAIDFLNKNPDEASKILSTKMDISPKEVYDQLTWPGVRFDKNPTGMIKFLDFMKEQGYVEKSTTDIKDLVWDTVDIRKSN